MDRLSAFLRKFFLSRFFGTVTIQLESGKVTHVKVETKKVLRYQDLPAEETSELQ